VNISSSKVVRTPKQARSMEMDPLFRQFFGMVSELPQVPKERRERSLGSGSS